MAAPAFYYYVQFLIAGAAVLVPIFLILVRREGALVAWICAVCCVDVFNAKVHVNLLAAPIAGLVLLPVTVRWLGALWRTHSGRALVLQYCYLVALGALFGFLTPWSDHGVLRAFNETAHGRTLIYLLHLMGDWSAAVFVANYIRNRQRMMRLFWAVLVGTTCASAAGLLSFVTRLDLYRLITGIQSQEVTYRLHGLNYEPRGLGLIAAYGVVACVAMLSRRQTPLVWLALLVNIVGLFTAVALSAVGAAAAGVLALMLTNKRSRLPLLVAGGCGLLVVMGIGSAAPQWMEQWRAHFGAHEVNEVQESGVNDWYDILAMRAGAFDAPALLYLRDHPVYALVGTGPGLIVLPDTEEAAKLPLYQWLWQQNASEGIVVQPTVGLILEASNGGLPDLLLMGALVLVGWRSLEWLARLDPDWHAAAGLFLGSAAIYAVQASTVSAIPYLLFAFGLAGERLRTTAVVAAERSGVSRAAPENPGTGGPWRPASWLAPGAARPGVP